MADTLELFAIGRRLRPSSPRTLATVHDSGAERVLVADIAERVGVAFAELAAGTVDRLARLLGAGLAPTNPLDVWSTGADTEPLFTECLTALADDDAVGVVALAVDLVPEYDGDDSYPLAVEALVHRTDKPVVVLTNVASAVDQEAAGRLRARGVPVLEGTGSGLRALAHLLARRTRPQPSGAEATVYERRRQRWRTRLAHGQLDEAQALALLADYGIRVTPTRVTGSADAAVAAAGSVGYPVVLKTAEGSAHKSDVGGVRTGLADAEAVRTAYADLARRLGPRVSIQHQEPAGVELAIGLVRDPLVGPLLVVAAGGTLVELVGSRAVALPPVTADRVREMLAGLVVDTLLDGVRGGPPADRDAVVEVVLGVAQLAVELGDRLEALDVNPLIVTSDGAVAVDALVLPRR